QSDTPELVEFTKPKCTGGEVLRLWQSDANLLLEEFLCLEGRGDYLQDLCVCGDDAATYHCQDCHGCELFYRLCMICSHERHPLHRIELWDGISFYSVTLKSMGICLQLGHASGVSCISPLSAHNDNFVIIDYNSIYEVGLDFCGCAYAKPHIIQLLRVRLFPATTVDLKTAATFRALEYFQMLSFESKVSTFEFYKTAACLTDNTGIHIPKDRYKALLRMMKRTGQGHHPDGIGATKPGACAVLCPACPHTGKNLPDGWENAPSEIRPRFLYALFLAIDTNFRLAHCNVSSDIIDPGLNRGYAFFVEEQAYKGFIGSHERVIQEYNFAILEVQECINDLINFEASLAADELVEWRKDIEAWEADCSQPNPFEGRAMTTMTQAAVHLALSMAEAAEIERGNNMCRLGFDAKAIGQHTTDVQKGKILQSMNTLCRRIDTWAQVQLLYMPSVSHLRSPDDIATETKAHNISLFLPTLHGKTQSIFILSCQC
ncbi:hypothetical protein CY34DRAFT_110813, partial [Suillus luteus UH-Slu-Lm8-n1]